MVIRASDGTEGHGFCFTVGRGNDVVAAAIEALRRPAPRTAADPAAPVNADLAEIASGRYVAPSAPGFSARMLPESIADHRYPQGPVWRARRIIKEVNS